MTPTQIDSLVRAALEARTHSYSPYSHFQVGAALLCRSTVSVSHDSDCPASIIPDEMGENCTIITGCNIENGAYSPSLCAERVAFAKAISEGPVTPLAIAIVGGAADATDLDYCPPCGVCRQVMKEFCKGDFNIILAKTHNGAITATKLFTLADLLPESFAL